MTQSKSISKATKFRVVLVGIALSFIMFGLYFAFYISSNNYKTLLENQDESSIMTALLNKLDGDILRTRQIETQFQINQSDYYVAAFRHGINQVITGASEIQTLSHSSKLHTILVGLIKAIARYQYYFFSLEEKYQLIGNNQFGGLSKILSSSIENIEKLIEKNYIATTNRYNDMSLSLLSTRLYINMFVENMDQQYVDLFDQKIELMISILKSNNAFNDELLITQLTNLHDDFHKLVNLTIEVKEIHIIIEKIMFKVPDLLTSLRDEITLLESNRHKLLTEEIGFINNNLIVSLPIAFFLTWLLISLYWRREQSSLAALESRNLALNNHKLAMTTLNSIGDGIIITDPHGNITNINPAAEIIIGQDFSSINGQNFNRVINLRSNIDNARLTSPLMECLRLKTTIYQTNKDTIIVRSNGSKVSIEESAAPIIGENGNLLGAIMVFRDVTEQRKLLAHIEHQAHHDPLTGLSNRSALKHALEYAWVRSQKEGSEHALIFIDLDKFKIINDTCGHHAGDELLKALTELISKQIRNSDIISQLDRDDNSSSDTLARVGGDEFAILLQDCPIIEAEAIAQHIVDEIRDYVFMWDGKYFKVGASVGIAQMNNRYNSISEVMQNADTACYEAKNRGRGNVCIYKLEDELLDRRHQEMSWVPRLNQALAENQFILRRQLISPLVESRGHVNHYEILISLREKGKDDLILPGAFLPAAERYHMMADIDRWVINQTFINISVVNDQSIYAINLSGDALGDKEMLSYIQDAFSKYNIDPTKLIFEITESAAISNLGHCQHLIDKLREIGCKFSLDDFGTGLSSFSYLKSLHVDYIKIDGCFIRNIATNKKDYMIVESINSLAHALEMETIAEFVEDEACLHTINQIGIDYGQGWALGYPTVWQISENDQQHQAG